MKVDVIVFSPPYSESVKPFETPEQTEKRRQRLYALGITEGDHKRGGLLRSIRAGNQYRGFAQGYGKNRNNIGNLRHGPPTNSEVEEEQVGNVLFFKPTPGFQGYKQFFHSESVMHPAKANLNMLRWIIERYTKEGDVVLDPMAGTGSTGIIACYLNRKAILIDLEQKFVDMMTKNIERFKKACRFWKVKRPTPVAMQGDSRQLSNILCKVDSIIFSPPYEKTVTQGKGILRRESSFGGQSKNGYSRDEDNIGNLRYEKIDTIITSPPYAEAQQGGGIAKQGYQGSKHSPTDLVGKRSYMPDKFENEENIGRLSYPKVDTIITSPPLGHESTASKPTKLEEQGLFKMGHSKETPYTKENYRFKKGKERGNIGKRKLFKRIPCSPEEAEFHDTRPERKGTTWEWTKEVKVEVDSIITSPPYEATFNVKKHTLSGIAKRDPNFRVEVGGYGKSDANLGNLHTETYLSAMLKVYRECWKVLKSNGKMVIIVKNFIRNKKIVRLDLDTIKLCKKAGFQLVERWYSQLKQQSFWRIIYMKKYPSVPKIHYEHILVFQKKR